MANLPVLFSAPMVRALLAGTKTQTRRTLKTENVAGYTHHSGSVWSIKPAVLDAPMAAPLPRYRVGDRLYVREHWRVSKRWDDMPPRDLAPKTMTVFFEAGGSISNNAHDRGGEISWQPSSFSLSPENADWVGKHRQAMHMPRWASRITLTVTEVRVERLQDCSREDAIAEGIEQVGDWWRDYRFAVDAGPSLPDPVASYRTLWNSINGPGSWDANPWVSAYTFTFALGNIDQIVRAA